MKNTYKYWEVVSCDVEGDNIRLIKWSLVFSMLAGLLLMPIAAQSPVTELNAVGFYENEPTNFYVAGQVDSDAPQDTWVTLGLYYYDLSKRETIFVTSHVADIGGLRKECTRIFDGEKVWGIFRVRPGQRFVLETGSGWVPESTDKVEYSLFYSYDGKKVHPASEEWLIYKRHGN